MEFFYSNANDFFFFFFFLDSLQSLNNLINILGLSLFFRSLLSQVYAFPNLYNSINFFKPNPDSLIEYILNFTYNDIVELFCPSFYEYTKVIGISFRTTLLLFFFFFWMKKTKSKIALIYLDREAWTLKTKTKI